MSEGATSSGSMVHRKKEPRIVPVLVLMIVFLGIARSFNSRFSLSKVPGPERGDLVLLADALPSELDGWKRVGFTPAEVPEELPDGQFWWVHAWGYSNGQQNCIISLDQADWTAWHDLTVCYQAVGWTLADRKVLEIPYPEGGTWHAVSADFTEASGRKAFLVFSLFGSDGTPMDSPWQGLFPEPVNDSFAERLKGRFNQLPAAPQPVHKKVNHERVLQSQVFLTYTGTLSENLRESLIELHLSTRPYFRDAWNSHWKQWQTRTDQ